MDEYVDVVVRALSILPDSVSIHRLTGDPPRRLLIAPDWATDKKRVLNEIRHKTHLLSRCTDA
jgi:radical SAM superfamily enzyme